MKHSFFILLFVTIVLHADAYKIGNGIKIKGLPIYIGGYITADYISQNNNYNSLRLDDVALITYGEYKRFSYLSELEIKEGYIKEWGKTELYNTSKRVNIERLYFDYDYSDTMEFRIGKFNTPIGYWNLTPISVLRDSASNPHLVYILYPRYSTGLQISYEDHLNDGNSYTLMIQNNSDLDDNYNNIFVKAHTILGVEHIGDDISYKANIGHFRTLSNDNFYYFLLAALYEQERYEISAEYGARKSSSKWIIPYTLYIQGVYHLAPKHDLISRFESYKIKDSILRHDEIGVLGYTYRPIYPITYKVEYQLHSYSKESLFKLSFSILF